MPLLQAHHVHADLQAALNSKLDAAFSQLQDSETASHRAQAHFQQQVGCRDTKVGMYVLSSNTWPAFCSRLADFI